MVFPEFNTSSTKITTLLLKSSSLILSSIGELKGSFLSIVTSATKVEMSEIDSISLDNRLAKTKPLPFIPANTIEDSW